MTASDTQPADLVTADGFRRRLFGYRPDQVDRRLDAVERELAASREEADRLREAADTDAALAAHLTGVLTRFAESVTAGEREAAERAAQIVADAEARALAIETQARELLADARDVAIATFAEAGRRYEEAMAARRLATERVESAIARMTEALGSLEAVPRFPELTLPMPIVADIRGAEEPAYTAWAELA